MILIPALIGGALATVTSFSLSSLGYLHRTGAIGLVLIAVAGFWPFFAVAAQDDGQLLIHLTIFVGFSMLALTSRRIGTAGLALALIAHGVLDAALFSSTHPGPLWWPAFCAGYDVTLGVILLYSLRKYANS